MFPKPIRTTAGRPPACSANSMDDARPAFVVQDRNYISARWPGDVHTFAKTFSGMLK